ncbi:serine hydrolase domain-containing protein [Pseudomonadota bacterium]
MKPLLSALQQRMHVRQIPGVSIRIAKHGKQLFSCELGVSDLATMEPLEPRHQFKIACMTKPIVAHAILHLAEQGQLDLDSSICRFVPELELQATFQSITVSHLLSHTAGLPRGPYYSHASSDEEILRRIRLAQLVFEPGKDYKYSNWGYFLLGKVIESISGQTPEDFISEIVLTPSGMIRSGFASHNSELSSNLATGYWKGRLFGSSNLAKPSTPCPHIPMPNCAGGLISNTDDYIRWLTVFTKENIGNDSLEAGVVEKMLQIQHSKSRDKFSTFGFFAEVIDDKSFYYFPANSSGFSSFVFIVPDLGLTGVAFANHLTCNNELREMLNQVCREVLDSDSLPNFGRRIRDIDIVAKNNMGNTINLRSSHGIDPKLIENGHKIRLYPHSEKSYFLLDGSHNSHMLRISGLDKENVKISLGDQVYYEKEKRQKRQPSPPKTWEKLTGRYLNDPFGVVEIINRENRLYLSYGVVYETQLLQFDDSRFKQKSGPFRNEAIEFKKKADKISSFVLNGMVFIRQFKLTLMNKKSTHHSRSTPILSFDNSQPPEEPKKPEKPIVLNNSKIDSTEIDGDVTSPSLSSILRS